MVQTDLQAIKEKIRQLESGSDSGSTVGSEVSTVVGKGPSGTFVRPPPGVAVRLNDLFMPRRMEFKGWDTDYRTEQGTWPTKMMVIMWFSNEANLLTRIGLPDIMREELKKGPYKQKGHVVSCRLELSLKRKPLAKAHALFYKGLEEARGESKIHVVHGKSHS